MMLGDAISIRDDPSVDQSAWAFLDLIQQLKVWTHTVNPRVMPASATVNPMDDLVLVTATATATLHTPVGFDGLWHTFVNTGAGTMTIASASNISGAASIATSRQWDCISVKSTGSTWVVLIRPGALTGDVTASGLTMNTARLLGRTTAGVGAVEEITVGAGLSLAAGIITATGGAPLRVTANQSLTTTTTLTNVTDLVFAIGVNEEWICTFELDIGAALTSTGAKFALDVPTGATLKFTANCPDTAATGSVGTLRTTADATALDFNTAFFPASALAPIHITAWILNGSTAGNVQLQFAQSSSAALALTILKGSYGVPIRVA